MKLAMRPEQFTEVCIKVLGVRLFDLEHLGSQTRRGWFTRNEHSAAVRVLLCTMARWHRNRSRKRTKVPLVEANASLGDVLKG